MFTTHLALFSFFDGMGGPARPRTSGHDYGERRKRADEAAARLDAEIKAQRAQLRADLLAAVERVTGKPPPLDAPLKQLASIARRSESFDYRGTLALIARLDGELRAVQEMRQAEAERQRRLERLREEEEFIIMELLS